MVVWSIYFCRFNFSKRSMFQEQVQNDILLQWNMSGIDKFRAVVTIVRIMLITIHDLWFVSSQWSSDTNWLSELEMWWTTWYATNFLKKKLNAPELWVSEVETSDLEHKWMLRFECWRCWNLNYTWRVRTQSCILLSPYPDFTIFFHSFAITTKLELSFILLIWLEFCIQHLLTTLLFALR